MTHKTSSQSDYQGHDDEETRMMQDASSRNRRLGAVLGAIVPLGSRGCCSGCHARAKVFAMGKDVRCLVAPTSPSAMDVTAADWFSLVRDSTTASPGPTASAGADRAGSVVRIAKNAKGGIHRNCEPYTHPVSRSRLTNPSDRRRRSRCPRRAGRGV